MLVFCSFYTRVLLKTELKRDWHRSIEELIRRVFQQLLSAVCLVSCVTVLLSYKRVCSFPGLWVPRDDIRSV